MSGLEDAMTLRELAERAIADHAQQGASTQPWATFHAGQKRYRNGCQTYIAAASPDVVLALLDRLDALERALKIVINETITPETDALDRIARAARAALTAEVAGTGDET